MDEYTAIIEEARAAIAARHAPDAAALEARVRAVRKAKRPRGEEQRAALDRAMDEALHRLDRVLSVHRARARLAKGTTPPAPSAPAPLRAALRTKPTVTANMDVRREGPGVLVWDAAPSVESWQLRISERPDARGDYVVREERELPGAATSVELPLGDSPIRVHLHGRGRGNRLLRRAVISGLTRESWAERWQRRGSAS